MGTPGRIGRLGSVSASGIFVRDGRRFPGVLGGSFNLGGVTPRTLVWLYYGFLVVLRVAYGEVSFLLTGDIEQYAESAILVNSVDRVQSS